MRIAYIGLGAMGRPMAANLAGTFDLRVWNRTSSVAHDHARAHGSTAVDELTELADADVICTCLPTTVEVEAVAQVLAPALAEGTVWLDHTSGDPQQARDLAALLGAEGVDYLDAPVSGGTGGAEAGALTVMVGGDADALDRVRTVLDVVAARVVHVGPSGAGMAVKAVNNAMLAASLWAAAEGFAALQKAGVATSVALEVVNASSGRSNATENLFPERVVTRAFPNTFGLALLAKDVGLARATLDAADVDGPVLHLVDRLTAEAAETLGADVDHTELVRMVERTAGVELR
ncbi:NAD(P)-dependent oxidoreductase [Egicoccus sp. AB-alg6-2]|uniref:NAD(P)-dependent oxidoreductase n=1 Tax=Egicoccus sp. AB-alg6-2 TaxID=3242692 RepID=UPI00359F018E